MHPSLIRIRRINRLMLLWVAGSGLFILGCVIVLGARSYVSSEVQAKIERLRSSGRVQFEVGSANVSVPHFEFGSIYYEDMGSVAIASINGSVSLNPFSKYPEGVRALTVDRAKGRMTLDQLQSWIARNKLNSNPSSGRNSGGMSIADRLPPVLDLIDLDMTILDDDGEELFSLKGLHASLRNGHLKFRFDGLYYKANPVMRGISGDLVLRNESDHYPFLVSNMTLGRPKNWEAKGELAKDFSEVSVDFKDKGIPPELEKTIGKYLGDHGESVYAGRIRVVSLRKRHAFGFQSYVGGTNIIIDQKRLAAVPIGPMSLRLKLSGVFQPSSGDIQLSKGELLLKRPGSRSEDESLGIQFSGSRDHAFSANEGKWEIKFQMPQTPCDRVIRVAPEGAVPHLKNFEMTGALSLRGGLHVSPGRPENFKIFDLTGTFDCQVISAGFRYARSRLLDRTPFFTSSLKDESVDPLTRVMADYTFLPEISDHLITAVVSSEDSGYFEHDGIEWTAIDNALRTNFRANRVVLGGSTISMQTAKNLFLQQDRTISRKVQELFLTWYLEGILTKEQILELYLNIIEYGPEIYGIKQASRFYFGKDPWDLDLRESVFLSSLLPSPKKRGRQYCRQELSSGYRDFVNSKILKLSAMAKITDKEREQAMGKTLVFHNTPDKYERLCTRDLALRPR